MLSFSIALVIGCPPTDEDPVSAAETTQIVTPDARDLESLPTPATVPFVALTRTSPVTLVDEWGQTLLVLDPIGVEVEVHRLLPDRAWVTCTGCRAPLDGWIQRAALLPVTVSPETDGLREQDRMLLWLAMTELPPAAAALRVHGLESASRKWLGPPWRKEGGYEGPTLIVRSDGEGFSADIQ